METEKMINQADAYRIQNIQDLRCHLTDDEYGRALTRASEALFSGEGLTIMEAMQDELAGKIKTLAER